MKRFFAAIIALMLLCAGALAEGAFVQGGGGAAVDGQYYMRVAEDGGDALVRIDPEGAPHIAMRAEALGDMVAVDGTLYHLARENDIWYLMARDADTAYVAYEFPKGKAVAELGERDGMLFVLIDDMLHVLYLQPAMCLQLAGAGMEEFAIHEDYAYYIARDSRAEHALAYEDGTVERSVGKLCRVNMSTGATIVIAPEGGEGLTYREGKLYFHSYADAYLMGEGDGASLEGHLACYDIATGELTSLTGDYDWDYTVTSGGVCVLRQEGLIRLDTGAVLSPLPGDAQIEGAGDMIVVFWPADMRFGVIPHKK